MGYATKHSNRVAERALLDHTGCPLMRLALKKTDNDSLSACLASSDPQ